jgi:cytochrome c peroxidase
VRATEWAIGCLIAVAVVNGVAASTAQDATAVHALEGVKLAEIGRLMFFDATLSAAGKLACAT